MLDDSSVLLACNSSDGLLTSYFNGSLPEICSDPYELGTDIVFEENDVSLEQIDQCNVQDMKFAPKINYKLNSSDESDFILPIESQEKIDFEDDTFLGYLKEHESSFTLSLDDWASEVHSNLLSLISDKPGNENHNENVRKTDSTDSEQTEDDFKMPKMSILAKRRKRKYEDMIQEREKYNCYFKDNFIDKKLSTSKLSKKVYSDGCDFLNNSNEEIKILEEECNKLFENLFSESIKGSIQEGILSNNDSDIDVIFENVSKLPNIECEQKSQDERCNFMCDKNVNKNDSSDIISDSDNDLECDTLDMESENDDDLNTIDFEDPQKNNQINESNKSEYNEFSSKNYSDQLNKNHVSDCLIDNPTQIQESCDSRKECIVVDENNFKDLSKEYLPSLDKRNSIDKTNLNSMKLRDCFVKLECITKQGFLQSVRH